MSILEKIRAWLLGPIFVAFKELVERYECFGPPAIRVVDERLVKHQMQLSNMARLMEMRFDTYLAQFVALNKSLSELHAIDNHSFDKLSKESHQLFAELDSRVAAHFTAVEKVFMYRFGVIDKKFEALDKFFTDIKKREEQIQQVSGEIQKELDGIRSRYLWVEERYQDMTRGVAPREFDFEKRQ